MAPHRTAGVQPGMDANTRANRVSLRNAGRLEAGGPVLQASSP
jgi:hypothetical protein